MEESKQALLTEEEADATVVAPRFDEGEAVTAQPVVPFAAVGVDEPPAPRAAPLHLARRYAPTRAWALALVLISALAGSVLGGAGLYLYQRRHRPSASPASVSMPEQPSSAVEQPSSAEPQPAASTAAETDAGRVAESSRETPPPAHAASDVRTEEATKDEGATRRARPERVKAAEPADDEDEAAADDQPRAPAAHKHGKRGEHEANVAARVAARTPPEAAPARDDEDAHAYSDRMPRRVGTIIYPTPHRTRERRAASATRAIDRVRQIFEGPQR